MFGMFHSETRGPGLGAGWGNGPVFLGKTFDFHSA